MLTVIIGRRKTGKSTLALSIAKTRHHTIIVFDPNNQFGNLPHIDNIDEFMENSDPGTMGRIVPTDVEADFDALAEALDGGSWKWGEYTLIVDEGSFLMSPQKVNAALERYARTSPKDVAVIVTTHRSKDINPLLRALATDTFIFNQQLRRDIEVIADTFGEEVAEESKTLGEYVVIHCWLDRGGVMESETWDNPAEWYIDIGRRT